MNYSISKGKVYRKILAAFVLINILMTVFLWGTYYLGASLVRREMASNLSSQNQFLAENIRTEMQRMLGLQYALSTSSDALLLHASAAIGGSASHYDAMLNIRQQLFNIQTSSNMIDEIYIIIPQAQLYISDTTIRNLSEAPITLEEVYRDIGPRQIGYYDGRLTLLSHYTIRPYAEGEMPLLLAGAVLAEGWIQEHLNSGLPGGGQRALFGSEHGILVGNSADATLLGEIATLPATEEENTAPRLQEHAGYYYQSTPLGMYGLSCVSYIPKDALLGSLSRYQLLFLLLILLTMVVDILFLRAIFKMIHRPLQKLVDAFGEVRKGILDVEIRHAGDDEFQYIYTDFNETIADLKQNIQRVYVQESLLQKARLGLLQAQINPHFLYNSFIMLSNRIQAGDSSFAAQLSQDLGNYFMTITRGQKDLLPLDEEWEHTAAYARIQQARFRGRASTQLAPVPEAWKTVLVPRLILQPVIENVFKHVVEKASSPTLLRLHFSPGEDSLDIMVEDNGSHMDESVLKSMQASLEQKDAGEITGLVNIHQRLRLVYGERAGLHFQRSKAGGLQVNMRILQKRIALPEEKEEKHVPDTAG